MAAIDSPKRDRILAIASIVAAAMTGMAGSLDGAAAPDLLATVDHLVYATPDLDNAVRMVEQRLGVRATPGGEHPGKGTRNALIALGPASYLEIIGPDPEQPAPAGGRRFGIDTLGEPRLAAWAAKTHDLPGLVRDAAAQRIKLGDPVEGSRRRPDGVVLRWWFNDPQVVLEDGIVPFFIDWGDSPHPARSAATGATLAGLRAEHPRPGEVLNVLARLGIDLPVTKASAPALIATIDTTTRGRVELR